MPKIVFIQAFVIIDFMLPAQLPVRLDVVQWFGIHSIPKKKQMLIL
jgi:hypothetical protein